LFDIDDAMGYVVARATQPALAAIKLAWWRERLEELGQGLVPAEPRLQAVFSELVPRGISGEEVAELEQAWAQILRSDDQNIFVRGIASRGPILFKLAASILGVPNAGLIDDAANSFVAADLARRGITALPPLKIGRSRSRASKRARPLTALGALARRDIRSGGPPFEREGTPVRAWEVFRHWLTGRY
jgi:phytoene synthase